MLLIDTSAKVGHIGEVSAVSCIGALNRKNLSEKSQDFISETYAIPMTEDSDKVAFTFEGKHVVWKNLSREEKSELLLKVALLHHDKEKIKKDPDSALMSLKWREKREVFAAANPKDSQKAHGTDHTVSAAIFSGIFAHLYNQYHLEAHIKPEEVLVSQFCAFL